MGPSEAVLLIVACGVTIYAINQVVLRDKLDTSRLVPFLASGIFGLLLMKARRRQLAMRRR